ncbi:unnamed protein product [Candidula unifasciata]|uniref:CUB domain-containing protein n=1 Tax=Candidula unifasciata TaxID=100452 RepID=A0A8S3ZLN5_9EUPU|nr:unnamed protein product [Candidula unifasciata]
MKGLTRNWLTSLVCMSVLGLSVWADKYTESADSACASSGKVLIATTMPATEHFSWSKQTPLNEGDSCKWIIRSSLDAGQVKLTFPILNLINATKPNEGDCIQIYDADEIEVEHSVDMVCGKVSQQVYTSSNSTMLVVFIRGDSEGNGSFTVIYSSESGTLSLKSSQIQGTSPQQQTSSSFTSSTTTVSARRFQLTSLPTKPSKSSSSLPQHISVSQMKTTPKSGNTSSSHPQTPSEESVVAQNTEKTIRIVGIIAAALAGTGLIFVVFKVTKCCKCLRKKDSSGASNAGSSSGERVRLAYTGHQDGGNGSHVHANIRADMSQPLSVPLDNDAAASASHLGATTIEDVHESDSDSQQDLGEPPPSYESLYLNELGEAITPPKYSPPAHHSSHPPRRVHTFN